MVNLGTHIFMAIPQPTEHNLKGTMLCVLVHNNCFLTRGRCGEGFGAGGPRLSLLQEWVPVSGDPDKPLRRRTQGGLLETLWQGRATLCCSRHVPSCPWDIAPHHPLICALLHRLALGPLSSQDLSCSMPDDLLPQQMPDDLVGLALPQVGLVELLQRCASQGLQPGVHLLRLTARLTAGWWALALVKFVGLLSRPSLPPAGLGLHLVVPFVQPLQVMWQLRVPVEQLLHLLNLNRPSSTCEGFAIVHREPRAAKGHEGFRQGRDVPLIPLLNDQTTKGSCLVAVDNPCHRDEPPILDTLHEDPDELLCGNEGPTSPEVGVTLWDLGGKPCPSSEPPLANDEEHIRIVAHQRMRYQYDTLPHFPRKVQLARLMQVSQSSKRAYRWAARLWGSTLEATFAHGLVA